MSSIDDSSIFRISNMFKKYMCITGCACIFYDFIDYFVGTEWRVVGWLFLMSLLYLGARNVVCVRFFKNPISKGAIKFELLLMINLIYYMALAIIQNDIPRYIGLGLLVLVIAADAWGRRKLLMKNKES